MWLAAALLLTTAPADGEAPEDAAAPAPTVTDWRYEVVPVSGEPSLVTDLKVTADGLSAGDLTAGWAGVRRVELVPPDGWTEATRLVLEGVGGGNGEPVTTEGSVLLSGDDGGYHRVHLAYLHYAGPPALTVEFKGGKIPDWQPVPGSLLYRAREGNSWGPETNSPGLTESGARRPDKPTSLKRGLSLRVHRWQDVEDEPLRVRDLRGVPLVGYATAPSLTVPDEFRDEPLAERFACVFGGLIRCPFKGETELSFRVTAGGPVKMWVGDWPPDLPQRTAPPTAEEWDAELAEGGFLRGALDGFADGVLTVRPLLGVSEGENETGVPRVPVRRGAVRSLWRSVIGEPVERVEEPPDADVLYAAGRSGDVRGVAGTLKAVGGEDLTFELNGEDRTVPLGRVRGVVFARTPLNDPTAKSEGGPRVVLDLVGRGRVPGTPESFDGEAFVFRPLGGGPAVSVHRRYVDRLEVAGGRSVYLTRLPYEAERTPYFDLPPALLVNEGPGGSAVRVGSGRFREYFAVGPRTRLTFQTGGAFDRLTATVGMAAGFEGDASVRVLAGEEVLFERASVTAGGGAVPVDVDVRGREAVTLEADFGAGGDVEDLVVWGDPTLVRE